jgi:hypothetical protein
VMARTGGPDPGLDAMMVRDFNCAGDAAKTADDLLASNRRGPWMGIAMANQRILQPVGKTGNTKVQGCDATGGRSHARTCFRGPPFLASCCAGLVAPQCRPSGRHEIDAETASSLDHGIYAFQVDNVSRPWGSSLRWTLSEPYSSRRSLYSA